MYTFFCRLISFLRFIVLGFFLIRSGFICFLMKILRLDIREFLLFCCLLTERIDTFLMPILIHEILILLFADYLIFELFFFIPRLCEKVSQNFDSFADTNSYLNINFVCKIDFKT